MLSTVTSSSFDYVDEQEERELAVLFVQSMNANARGSVAGGGAGRRRAHRRKSAACGADEDNEEEAEEAANRYFAETRRRRAKGDEADRRPANRQHSKLKQRQRAFKKIYRSTSCGLSANVLAYLHQAPLAAALLGEPRKNANEANEEEEDWDVEDKDIRPWASFLALSQPACCSSMPRSLSTDDRAGFPFGRHLRSSHCGFDKDYRKEIPRNYGRKDSTVSELQRLVKSDARSPRRLSSVAGVASSDGEFGGCLVTASGTAPSRAMLVDLDASEGNNLNTVTTNASNGGLTDPDRLSNHTHTPLSPSLDIATVNVGGLRFQTYVGTLERFPHTLLGDPVKRSAYFNPKTGEYFFDRHRGSFEAIMYYYQSNGKKLCRPESVPPDIFLRELQYFEMGRDVIERFLESQGCVRPKELLLPRSRVHRKIWLLMEHPDSSLMARILAFVSVFVIIISTLSFCLETIPDLKYRHANISGNDTGNPGEEGVSFDNPFFIVELCCMCWFTLEFLLRLISCPSKLEFCKSVLNIIDFVAIVPFFVNLAWSSLLGAGGSTPPFGVLRIFRLVRVFRIFKLSRHSRGLQILGKTFTASVQELCLLIFFLVLGLVLFSSAVYIAEVGYESGFDSIPAAFWYVIVTMTTVGYGDLTPKGPWGKLVGGMCAIVGVLVLALPVPVIVANFKHYYRQEVRLARMRAVQNEDAADDKLCDDDDSRSS